ncbi:MAG: SGNH/GDSL hydrolase family protein [Gammaproteobacteria bacterium]
MRTSNVLEARRIGARKQLGLATLLLITALALFAGRANAFSNLYVFGDSLSDTGNVFINNGIPIAPYDNGRFSNGPVWVETLASGLGLSAAPVSGGGTNFAFGGAPTGLPVPPQASPSLVDQVNGLYLPAVGGVADPNGLYVVFGGGNDIRAGVVSGTAGNIGSIIDTLYAAGARNFLVPNLPDIGLTPEAIGFGPAAQMQATAASQFVNAGIASEIADARATLAGITIFDVDTFGFLNAVIANPASVGISNVDTACYDGTLGVGGPGSVCGNPDEYVFWDGIHPTAKAHQLLGEFALAQIPVPAAVWLFGSAIGLLGFARRKVA